jgi:hypothetical protein
MIGKYSHGPGRAWAISSNPKDRNVSEVYVVIEGDV